MFSQGQKAVLATTILFGVSYAAVLNSRAASDICGQKGYDQGNGNYCEGFGPPSMTKRINSYKVR